MPDIDPAALTRIDSTSQPLGPPGLTSKLNGITAISTQKATKVANAVQRVDLEPLYTSLKAAIADHWSEYKEAMNFFVLGKSEIAMPARSASGNYNGLVNHSLLIIVSPQGTSIKMNSPSEPITSLPLILLSSISTTNSLQRSSPIYPGSLRRWASHLGSPLTTSRRLSQNL
jgi:hypothetical protein